MSISVAIVEDSADWTKEMGQVITEAPDLKLSCICRSVRTALAQIPAAAPDVVLMDINLPDGSGIDATAQLKKIVPKTEFLIFTVYEDTEEIFKALEAGASGYLLKRSTSTELVSAIRNLMKGEVPMTGEIARKIIQSFQKKDAPAAPVGNKYEGTLTPREQDILQMLARGLPTKEIAAQCSISAGTVSCHLKKIYEKLHVHSRTEAVLKYLE